MAVHICCSLLVRPLCRNGINYRRFGEPGIEGGNIKTTIVADSFIQFESSCTFAVKYCKATLQNWK